MIKFDIDADKALKQVEKALGNLKSEAPKVIVKSVNSTAKEARKLLVEEAQKEYVIKTGRLNKAMKLKNATVNHPQAAINAKGKVSELTDFKTSPAATAGNATKNSSFKTAKGRVLTASGMKELQIGNIKAFLIKFRSGHVTLAQRKSDNRLPVKVLYSPSVPKILGNEKKVYGVVAPKIKSLLKEQMMKQIQKTIQGGVKS